jgi:preprotein translocase subunit SecG
MSFLLGLLIVVHVLVCLLLIGVVLIQRGEGGSLMSAFASQSQTVFGSQAINVFVKTTWVLGSLFFLLSITLAIAFGQRLGGGGTVLSDTDRPVATSVPASAASSASAPASTPASAPASVASAPVSAPASAPVASTAKPASSPAPKASVAKPAASTASAPASAAKPASAASAP